MKKLFALLIACSLSIASLSPITVNADDDIKVYLNGAQLEFEVSPVIIDGTTFVPMRKIFEELGAAVEWIPESMRVKASSPGVLIEIPIGSNEIYRNSVPQNIETPAFVSYGSTLIPLRLVSEYLGCNVQWDGETKSIYINSTNVIQRLFWNNNYYYVGFTNNGSSSGYGILYEIHTDKIVQIGFFEPDNLKLGTRYYDDGSWYYGDWKDGKFNGYGQAHLADGTIFSGHFENGLLNGYGKATYSSGTIYEGNWIDGKENGAGKTIFPNGEIYDGEKVNGYMSGQGVYYFLDGSIYTGSFANDKFNGQGTMNYKDGSYYKGTWLNNIWDGYGEYYNASVNCSYTGYFSNGKKNGLYTIYDHTYDTTMYCVYENDVLTKYSYPN